MNYETYKKIETYHFIIMPRKKRFGICILFGNDHYYFRIGNIDSSPEGDVYFGLGKKGEHISFHNSFEVHYIDQNGEKTIINEEDSSKLFVDILNNFTEPFQDLNTPQKKLIIKLLNHLQPAFSFDGCFNPNCKNKGGLAIRFDVLIELSVEYLNTHKKTVLQVLGLPIDENDYEEEEDDDGGPFDKIFSGLDIGKIPKCVYCQNKRVIQYKNKKFEWLKCPRCNGLGFDLDYLKKYKI